MKTRSGWSRLRMTIRLILILLRVNSGPEVAARPGPRGHGVKLCWSGPGVTGARSDLNLFGCRITPWECRRPIAMEISADAFAGRGGVRSHAGHHRDSVVPWPDSQPMVCVDRGHARLGLRHDGSATLHHRPDPAISELIAASDPISANAIGDPIREQEYRERIQRRVARSSGCVTSIFMVGWAFGGFIFGVAGDRIGRARTMFITIMLYSVATGLSAFAVNIQDFTFYRLLAGLGVGGEFAVGIALVAETLPDRARPFALAWVQAISVIGNMTAAAIGMIFGMLETSRVVSFGGLSAWRHVFGRRSAGISGGVDPPASRNLSPGKRQCKGRGWDRWPSSWAIRAGGITR